MHLKILTVISLFFLAKANNPFEGGFVRMKCLEGRTTGCSQTLVEAYKNTNLSESDQNINDPDTYMMLFTRKNKENPEYLDECGGSVPDNTYFNKEWDVVIIIHGYMDTVCKVAWMREMMYQFLFRDNYNVILIDYGWGNQVDYYDAARNIIVVGKQVAFMIKNIVEKTGISTEKIHLIGHSLGGQACGVAGYYVQKLLATSVRRITGLDPAGPAFQNTAKKNMLDKSDASFVDIIHSNAGECVPFSFGHSGQLGHLDFFPNGGSVQRSCMSNILPSILKGDFYYAMTSLLLSGCFHVQSIQYFIVSINCCGCQFIGVKCDNDEGFESGKCSSCGTDGSNCAVMGMDAEYYPWKEGNNTYYLDTSTSCPYCDNNGIKLEGFPLLPPGKEKPKCFPETSNPLSILG